MNALARLLAAAVFAVSLTAHARQHFDACIVAEGSAGTVESVRQVPLPRDLHAFDPEVFEHSVRAREAQELVVRLDAGPLVVFSQRQPLAVHAGQRVRVQLEGSAARVDPDSAC